MLNGHNLLCKGKVKCFSLVAQLYLIIFNAFTRTLYSVYLNNANDCFIFQKKFSEFFNRIHVTSSRYEIF